MYITIPTSITASKQLEKHEVNVYILVRKIEKGVDNVVFLLFNFQQKSEAFERHCGVISSNIFFTSSPKCQRNRKEVSEPSRHPPKNMNHLVNNNIQQRRNKKENVRA